MQKCYWVFYRSSVDFNNLSGKESSVRSVITQLSLNRLSWVCGTHLYYAWKAEAGGPLQGEGCPPTITRQHISKRQQQI